MDANANPLGIKKIPVTGLVASKVIIRRGELGALSEAADIVNAAHDRSIEIIQQAEADANEIRIKTREDAEREIWQEADGLLEDLKSVREQMAAQSIEVAQSILQKAWEILTGGLDDAEKLRFALEQAGRYFVSTSAMRIRVNPEMLADAQAWLEKRRNRQAGLELLTAESDISVRPDEVRLYLDRGGVIRADFAGTLEILKAQWT